MHPPMRHFKSFSELNLAHASSVGHPCPSEIICVILAITFEPQTLKVKSNRLETRILPILFCFFFKETKNCRLRLKPRAR